MTKLRRVLLTFVGLGIAYSGILVLSSYFKTLPELVQTHVMYSIIGGVIALFFVLLVAVIGEGMKK